MTRMRSRIDGQIPNELSESNRTIISRASPRGDEMAGGGCGPMRPSNAQTLRSDATRWLERPAHRDCVPFRPRCGPESRHRKARGGRGILPLYPERSCPIGTTAVRRRISSHFGSVRGRTVGSSWKVPRIVWNSATPATSGKRSRVTMWASIRGFGIRIPILSVICGRRCPMASSRPASPIAPRRSSGECRLPGDDIN